MAVASGPTARTRVNSPLESKLSFLSTVLDADDEDAFGRELWRVGLFVDDSTRATLRANIDWNRKLVAAVVSPTTVATTLRERLSRAGVAPGPQFETVISTLAATADVRDSSEWTRRLFDDHGIKLTDIARLTTRSSPNSSLGRDAELQEAQRRPRDLQQAQGDRRRRAVRRDVERAPRRVGVRWKSRPAKPTDVAQWLLELVPPVDLRDDDTPSVLEMKVKGGRASAQLKLELGADDLYGRSAVRRPAHRIGRANATPMLLSDGTLAASESDQFEVVIQEALADRSTTRRPPRVRSPRRSSEPSSPVLRTPRWTCSHGISAAASTAVRVGKHLASQIRVAPVVVGLQRGFRRPVDRRSSRRSPCTGKRSPSTQ